MTFNKVSREKVLEILREIKDPASRNDILSLGWVHEVEIGNGRIFIHLETTPETADSQEFIKELIQSKVGQLDRTMEVDVYFSQKIKESTAAFSGQPIPGVRYVVAVASGKGGVGKSTVAVNLALAFKQLGVKVGLMDADIYGPNIPLMLGVPEGKHPEMNAEGKITPLEAQGMKTISIGFFAAPDQPIIWRGPLLHKTIEQFLHAVAWGELDILVVDLPPGTGDVQLSLAQWVKLAGAVVVSTPQEVALSDVRRAVNMFRKMEVPVLGVIENMTGPVFGKGGGEKMAEVFKVPFLGDIPLEAAIREGGDSGQPVMAEKPEDPISRRFIKIAETIQQELYKIAN